MRLDVRADELRSLLDGPTPATITIQREDGQAITSPVWFRVENDAFEFVVAASDSKLIRLRRDPRCVLLIFEASPPFRGVMVRDQAARVFDEGAQARLAIATKYLGPGSAREYADLERRPPGWIVRLPIAAARAWSLADALPSGLGETNQ